jgi:hypothetical protein
VRHERRELRDKVKALETEVERLRTSQTPDLTEVTQLRAQLTEYEAKLGQHDLASTRAFKARYDVPAAAALQKGVSVLVRTGRDAEQAKATVQKLTEHIRRDGTVDTDAIQTAVSDEPYAVQGALLMAVTEYAEASKARHDALAKWNETKAAMSAQAAHDQEVTLTEHIERDVPAAVQQALRAGNFMYAPSKVNQAWNAGVEQRIAAIKGVLRSAKPSELVQWVAEGVTAKATRDLLAKARADYAKVKAELDRLVSASPRLSAGGDGSPRPATSGKPRGVDSILAETFGDSPRRAF